MVTSLLPIINGNSGTDTLGVHYKRFHYLIVIKNKMLIVNVLIFRLVSHWIGTWNLLSYMSTNRKNVFVLIIGLSNYI